MTDEELLSRITSKPETFEGKATIGETRISVRLILSLMSKGMTQSELLDDYPGLEEADIRACLLYASRVLEKPASIPDRVAV